MIEKLISFEIAKLAKEKGFLENSEYFYTNEDGLCTFGYDGETLYILDDKLNKISDRYDCNSEFWFTKVSKNGEEWEESYEPIMYFAPTQSLLQKWLRKEYKIDIIVTVSEFSRTYGYKIYYINKGITEVINNRFCKFENYEEALEVGLQQALKLI